jgi:glycosyltransferase involved in cell wall biosynthesis
VHFPAFSPPLLVKTARRVVVTVHDATYWRYPATLSTGARWYYKPSLEAQLHCKRIDGVLTDSESAAGDLRQTGKFHMWITGVPLGVDDPFRSSESRPASHGDDPADRYILTVGTREPRKNLQTLVTAYATLAREDVTAPRFLIVGRAGWGGHLDIPRDVRDRIQFVEAVTDEQLASYYSGCSLFAIPSRYEGFGLPLLEALACGAPCVAADIPVFHEVAGYAALYASPDDIDAWVHAIQQLLEDPPLCAALSKSGIRRAATFTWQDWAAATASAYEQVSGL